MDSNKNFKYTIYKTTNTINGKVYIGCHKTLNPNDEYIGSGTILKRAICKYGRETFVKEVLFIFDNSEEMFSKEAEIVDSLFVESETSYNLLIGGQGGFEYINTNGKNLYGKNGDATHGNQNLKDGKVLRDFFIENGLWEAWKKKVSEGAKAKYARDGFHWTGRKHKEVTKKRIGEKMSITQRGNKNSQYGTCWIYSLVEKRNLRIKKEDLVTFLGKGWIRGRKMIF